MPERATVMSRSEKSAEAVVAARDQPGEGPNEKDSHETCRLESAMHQKPAQAGRRR